MTKEQAIAIHGGGYVGLTAAVHYALAGLAVTVYDPDPKTVDGINNGRPRDGDFLRYLHADVTDLVRTGRLRATHDFNAVADFAAHSLAVPTEKNGQPHDAIVTEVLRVLAGRAAANHTVLVESTLAPGTIDALLPTLKKTLPPGLEIGKNWFLAVCPRRDWFADPEKNLSTLTRVVGGVTPACTQKAVSLLSNVSRDILTTDYRTAEICKALENALLHVPLMFAHQLASALPNHNVAEALRLAGTHWRLMNLHLGFGTGGRCVPLGTKYLLESAGDGLTIGREALACDENLRALIAESVAKKIGGGRALVLGIGYRPGFKDAGLSPGLAIAQRLKALGSDAAVCDPLWTDDELARLTGLPTRQPSRHEDAILLATPHAEFLTLPANQSLWRAGQRVLDAQGTWKNHAPFFKSLGIEYAHVGGPGWMG